jgi:hypothetical protein
MYKKIFRTFLIIGCALGGFSELTYANDGWDLDYRGQPDLFSPKNQARWAQAQQAERDRQAGEYRAWQERSKPIQYRPAHEDSGAYMHPGNGNPYAAFQNSAYASRVMPSAPGGFNTDRAVTSEPRSERRISQLSRSSTQSFSSDQKDLEERQRIVSDQLQLHQMLNDMNDNPLPTLHEAINHFQSKTISSLTPKEQEEWKELISDSRETNKKANSAKHKW